MKKILSTCTLFLLVFCLVFALASCSEKEVENENSGQNIENEEQIEPETKPTEPSKNPLPAEAMQKIGEIYGAATIKPQTVTTVQELAILTSINYNEKGRGPISVTPAKLNGKDITLVTLGGTQFVEGQATTVKESQLASQGKSNDYLKALVALFDNGTIPKGKPVIVTGISLGGMIAQQVIGVPSIMDNYEIEAIITFGSPLTMPLDRKGVKVVRFADKSDMVPSAGESMLGMFPQNRGKVAPLQAKERILEASKYREPMTTHGLSYIEDECWNKYDFLGQEPGTNTLVTLDSMKFYPAPQLA